MHPLLCSMVWPSYTGFLVSTQLGWPRDVLIVAPRMQMTQGTFIPPRQVTRGRRVKAAHIGNTKYTAPCHLTTNYINNEPQQKRTPGEVADWGRRQVSTCGADVPTFKPRRQTVKYQRRSAKDGGIF
jgi:hypothetical protein